MVYPKHTIYQNPVTCLGDDLFKFLNRSYYSAHLRDIDTNKYILGNEFSTRNIGLPSQNAIVGMTPDEVIAHRLDHDNNDFLSSWNHKLQNLLNKTYSLSKKILSERTPAIQQDIELSFKGFVRITQTIRSPIFNSKKQIVAIASVDYDFSQQCELPQLFNLYQRYLPEQKAIQNFLQFLDIDHYFHQIPTKTELMVVLLMCQSSSIDFLANALKVPPKTVEAYKDSLASKFFNFDLTHLLINLRTRHESDFEFWD